MLQQTDMQRNTFDYTTSKHTEKGKLTCVLGLAGFLLQQGDHGPQFANLILRRVQLHTACTSRKSMR